jgi:hypothetical protein
MTLFLQQELLKHTERTHVDYGNLGKALTQIQELNQYINAKKTEFDNKRQLVIISGLIARIPNIISPTRAFVKEGNFFFLPSFILSPS